MSINNNKVNFGSVNLVQISKRAFANPENLSAVEDVFSKQLDSASGESFGILTKLFTKFGIRKKATKSLYFLETPSYSMIDDFCRNKHIPNQYWLGKRFGINVQQPLNPDVHSFYVLTKGDKDTLWDLTLGSKNNEIAERTRAIVSERRKLLYDGKEYLDFTDGDDFFNIEERIVADSLVMPEIPPVNRVFKVGKLAELAGTLAKIDY